MIKQNAPMPDKKSADFRQRKNLSRLVSRVLLMMTIYLFLPLPAGLSDYMGTDEQPLNVPLSILLRMGFTGPQSRQRGR